MNLTTPKAYIATKWENRARAAELAEILEQYGWEITRKWWAYPSFEVVTPEYQQAEAIDDIAAVRAADVVYVIMEKDLPYRGAWAEFGAALAFGKPVFVIGEEAKKCVFAYHPLVTFVEWPL